MVCSLTRTAAAEVAGRGLPIDRKCVGTLHAHCYRALGFPRVASGEALVEWNEMNPEFSMDCGSESDVDEPGWDRRVDSGAPGLPTSSSSGEAVNEEYQLLRARLVPPNLWPERVAAFAAKWEAYKSERGLVDFTDMIAHCLEAVDEAPGSPRAILCDEAQDMSALEYALVRKWGRSAGTLFIVGDPLQSLYTWRGAHPELFADKSIPADRRRVLGRSYRVPRRVLDAAVSWARRVSDYADAEYKPRLCEDGSEAPGEVKISACSWKTPARIVSEARALADAGKTVMIAGACSFMVVPALIELRKLGVPFANPWRRRRGDWNPLHVARGTSMANRVVSLLRPSRFIHGDDRRLWTYKEANDWASITRAESVFVRGGKTRLAALAKSKPDEPVDEAAYSQVFDYDAVIGLITMLDDEGRMKSHDPLADPLAWFLDQVQAVHQEKLKYPLAVRRACGYSALEEDPRIFVGTIHSFKGAEADVVYLFPDISPAGMREWQRDGETRDSVVRMFYVGMTRARERLVVCQPASSLSVPLCASVMEFAA